MSNMEFFGYQELLETGINVRSCTVTCLKNESTLITIDKTALVAIIRRNPQVLDMMKLKWTQFLVERVSNRLYVEQLQIRNEANDKVKLESIDKKCRRSTMNVVKNTM